MKSSWLTMAASMPQPPLWKPWLLRSQKFNYSGYHCAVVKAQQAAVGRLQLFTDADGATPIQELARLEEAVANGADVAIGSRSLASRLPNYAVQTRWYRTILSSLFHSLIQRRGLRGIADTQCGFKLFRRTVATDLFEVSSIDGFGFDIELLFVAQQRGYRIAEIPVNWSHQPGSKLRVVRDGLAMLRELAVIRRNRTKGYYAAPSHPRDFHPNPVSQLGLPPQ
jgi:dolichyl-phosphate beta-glucosyltransferase